MRSNGCCADLAPLGHEVARPFPIAAPRQLLHLAGVRFHVLSLRFIRFAYHVSSSHSNQFIVNEHAYILFQERACQWRRADSPRLYLRPCAQRVDASVPALELLVRSCIQNAASLLSFSIHKQWLASLSHHISSSSPRIITPAWLPNGRGPMTPSVALGERPARSSASPRSAMLAASTSDAPSSRSQAIQPAAEQVHPRTLLALGTTTPYLRSYRLNRHSLPGASKLRPFSVPSAPLAPLRPPEHGSSSHATLAGGLHPTISCGSLHGCEQRVSPNCERLLRHQRRVPRYARGPPGGQCDPRAWQESRSSWVVREKKGGGGWKPIYGSQSDSA